MGALSIFHCFVLNWLYKKSRTQKGGEHRLRLERAPCKASNEGNTNWRSHLLGQPVSAHLRRCAPAWCSDSTQKRRPGRTPRLSLPSPGTLVLSGRLHIIKGKGRKRSQNFQKKKGTSQWHPKPRFQGFEPKAQLAFQTCRGAVSKTLLILKVSRYHADTTETSTNKAKAPRIRGSHMQRIRRRGERHIQF